MSTVPTYDEAAGIPVVSHCSECGALIGDAGKRRHQFWHERLARMFRVAGVEVTVTESPKRDDAANQRRRMR